MNDIINSYDDLTDAEKKMFRRIADAICIGREVLVSFDAFKTSFEDYSFQRPYGVQTCAAHLAGWLEQYLTKPFKVPLQPLFKGGALSYVNPDHAKMYEDLARNRQPESHQAYDEGGQEYGRYSHRDEAFDTLVFHKSQLDVPKHVDSDNARYGQGPAVSTVSTEAFKAPREWTSALTDWLTGAPPSGLDRAAMSSRKAKLKGWFGDRGVERAPQLDESGWRDLLRFIDRHDLAERPVEDFDDAAFLKAQAAQLVQRYASPDGAQVHGYRYEVQPFEPTTVSEHFQAALSDLDHPYYELAHVLLGAFEQAAMGKGKERHANDLPFTEQKILQLPKQQGHVGGLIYQVAKKALESERMKPDARVRELRGVIVYAAAAITFTENGGA